MNISNKPLALVFLAIFLTVTINTINSNKAHASDTPVPSVVTVVGGFQDELGCPGDWQPDCVITSLSFDAEGNVWYGGFNLPAGNHEYKVALNNSWTENYGANATINGANIVLSLAEPAEVWFYYSHETHWITDNVNSVIPVVAGTFQDEIGCLDGWQASCLRSWLQDPDGDGLYVFSTSEIPPETTHEFKWVIHLNGENGDYWWCSTDNDVLTMPSYVTEVTFTFDPIIEELDFSIGPPPVPHYRCDGFRPPLAESAYRLKRNKAIPLRAKLFDGDEEITDVDLADTHPPVVDVTNISGLGELLVDTADVALPLGAADEGDQFYYIDTDEGYWQLILNASAYRNVAGVYVVEIRSGETSDYIIEPKCWTSFEVAE